MKLKAIAIAAGTLIAAGCTTMHEKPMTSCSKKDMQGAEQMKVDCSKKDMDKPAMCCSKKEASCSKK